MTTTFALLDPLRTQTVQIHILVQPAPEGETDRANRPAMVAVGIEGAPPQMLTGIFADIPTLIDTAWRTVPTSVLSAVTAPTPPPQVIAQSTVPTATPSQPVPTTEPTQGILDLF